MVHNCRKINIWRHQSFSFPINLYLSIYVFYDNFFLHALHEFVLTAFVFGDILFIRAAHVFIFTVSEFLDRFLTYALHFYYLMLCMIHENFCLKVLQVLNYTVFVFNTMIVEKFSYILSTCSIANLRVHNEKLFTRSTVKFLMFFALINGLLYIVPALKKKSIPSDFCSSRFLINFCQWSDQQF